MSSSLLGCASDQVLKKNSLIKIGNPFLKIVSDIILSYKMIKLLGLTLSLADYSARDDVRTDTEWVEHPPQHAIFRRTNSVSWLYINGHS